MNNSKRNYRIAVNLNEEENKQLEFISKELGISRAEAIRELITDSSYELYYGHKRGKKSISNMKNYAFGKCMKLDTK